jgi:hypothetical protein
MRQISDQNALYEMARLIASEKSGDRPYRDDIIAEAYLAVASGTATNKRGLENAVRASLRGEWSDDDRHVNLQISDSVARQGAPERALPDLWEAMAALDPVQRGGNGPYVLVWAYAGGSGRDFRVDPPER